MMRVVGLWSQIIVAGLQFPLFARAAQPFYRPIAWNNPKMNPLLGLALGVVDGHVLHKLAPRLKQQVLVVWGADCTVLAMYFRRADDEDGNAIRETGITGHIRDYEQAWPPPIVPWFPSPYPVLPHADPIHGFWLFDRRLGYVRRRGFLAGSYMVREDNIGQYSNLDPWFADGGHYAEHCKYQTGIDKLVMRLGQD